MNNAAQQAIYRCLRLAECTEEPGRITRRFLTPPFREVHELIQQWMQDAGMRSWIDAAGNLIGVQGDQMTKQGWTKPTILIGSHLDTVPNAGAYDGILGVMIGLAVAERFQNIDLPVSISVVGFSEEEGVRFAQPYLGSAALAGHFPSHWLSLRDQVGKTVDEVLRDFGLSSELISAAAIPVDKVRAYVEPHLEQGPLLESKRLPVGVVTSIIGQTRLLVRFKGEAGHAGTTPMNMRRDALVAAAEWTVQVHRLGQSVADLRATVGRLNVSPNASNVIPLKSSCHSICATRMIRLACRVLSSYYNKRFRLASKQMSSSKFCSEPIRIPFMQHRRWFNALASRSLRRGMSRCK